MTDDPVSRLLVVADLPENEERTFAFSATEAECAALATRLGAPAVGAFGAEFRIAARAKGRIRVEGEITARLTQVCVVSLDPFETTITESATVDFAPEADAAEAAARAAHEPPPGETIADQPDPPDPIVDGRIDLGAVAVEFLALALDPYPRKPGVAFAASEAAPDEADSPFADLGRLKLDKT